MSRYDLGDQQKVVVEFEPNGEKTCPERLYDDVHESVSACLIVCGVIGLRGLRNMQRARFVSLPDSVEELCDECFYWCDDLSRVTFGESSSLRRIGERAFYECRLDEIHIPDHVEELCDECFSASSASF